MVIALLIYNNIELEMYSVAMKGNPTDAEMTRIFKGYKNVELLENCEDSVVSVKPIVGVEYEIIRNKMDEAMKRRKENGTD